MRGFKRWIDAHPRKNLSGFFSINGRAMTDAEVRRVVSYAVENGYETEADIPSDKLAELLKGEDKLIVPKFKVGDKIEKLGYRFTIIQVKDNNYLTKCGNKIPIDNQDDFALVPYKFDITTLSPFDKVLVRDSYRNQWRATLFSHIGTHEEYPYETVCGRSAHCIPYKGNEYLLGTSKDCDDYYKIWKL